MAERIALTYGTGSITLDFPDVFVNRYIPGPRQDLPGLGSNVCKAIDSAFNAVQGTDRITELARGRKVAVVIPDEFRAGPHRAILKCMSDRLKDSGYDEVRVLVSTGSHSPDYFTRNLRGWVKEFMGGLPNVSFHANDIDNDEYIDLGVSERGVPHKVNRLLLETDLRVYTHESKFHYMNGYSVIDKLLLPGLCAGETIERNHKLSLDSDRCCAGRSPYAQDPGRRDNPMALDIQEARRKADATLLRDGERAQGGVKVLGLDMVSSGSNVLWAQAGDVEEVNRQMTRKVDAWGGYEVERTRYVVISPGGPPSSTTVYGTQNCFDMALKGAITEGGEALVIAPCEGKPDMPEEVRGLSPSVAQKDLFFDSLVKLHDRPYPEARRYIEQNFRLGFWKTNRILDLMNVKKVKLYLHSTLPREKIAPSGIIPVDDPQAWVEERAARGDGKANVIDGGNRLFIRGRD